MLYYTSACFYMRTMCARLWEPREWIKIESVTEVHMDATVAAETAAAQAGTP